MTEQIRNKYNTLTPAEAKKLGKYLTHRQAPIRTASVLNKPRAPPIVVTNLDDNGIDLKPAPQQQQQISRHYHDSISNLSFKSSRDSPDYAHEAVHRNFQTMSVDMSHQHAGHCRPASIAFDTMRARMRYQPKRSNTLNSRTFDDSFSSAKSDIINLSGRSSSATPTKFSYFPANIAPILPAEADRSSSKLSLSSSTYRVFQSPLAKFKRLFRGIQRPFSQAGSNQPDSKEKTSANNNDNSTQLNCAQSLADFSLSDSLSQSSLNKSQSPTVLPPALPYELRSLGYIDGGGGPVNYSNYDEFTKARNKELALPKRSSRSDTNGTSAPQQQSSFVRSGGDDSDEASWQMTSLPVYFERNLTTVFEEKQHPVASADLADSRQRRQGRRLTQTISPIDLEHELKLLDNEEIYQAIKPPKKFDDLAAADDAALERERRTPASPFRFSFGQPLTDSDQVSVGVIRTSRVALQCNYDEHHRSQSPHLDLLETNQSQTPPFQTITRQISVKSNLGLPPRLPSAGVRLKQPASATPIISETNQKRQQHDNSSSGNSSNCSSQVNVINYCDRQNPSSLDSSSLSSTTNTTNNNIKQSSNIDCNPLTYSTEDELGDVTTYGNLTDLDLNDPDATIQSETSTIRCDNIAAIYANKCAEFERTVASLKNKLIAKEKELTELQLAQLNNDYTIERLRERLGKLERENNQLKTLATASNVVF